MTLKPSVDDDDHTLGDVHAPVTLVEFGDYECPYCAEAQETVAELRREFGHRIRYVFRNFPLEQIHPYAVGAALVAEAAKPDQFWALHDLIYANQEALDEESLLKYAQQAGVSEETARAAIGGATLDRIERDVDSGTESGVQGTPAFYVNGRLHEGEWRGAALADAIRRSAAGS